ncbi:hypothetical protein [Listeria cornellensis]|uniref:hypothetical protein n=1 Tax=Listeria cornellensis TaxID=1494961 RepID=UPI0004B5B143|nr:hypothetical protein [Listeria cornellensis]
MDIKALMIDKLRRDLKLSDDVELIVDDGSYFQDNESPSLYVPDNSLLADETLTEVKTLGYDIKYNKTLDNQMEMEFSPILYSKVLSEIRQDNTLLTEAQVELKEDDSFYDFLAVNKLYAKKNAD